MPLIPLTNEGLRKFDEMTRDARTAHDLTGKDEKGHRQQWETLHPAVKALSDDQLVDVSHPEDADGDANQRKCDGQADADQPQKDAED